jgi:uroporphyrinogen-III synthase
MISLLRAQDGEIDTFEARSHYDTFDRRLLVRASMKDKTVAILESRMRDHIASLVRKYGGTPFSAPALAEIPDVDPTHIDELIRAWNSAPPDIFIFQTGVGTRALFAATDSLGLTDVLLQRLASAQVVVRGPKPATVLHSRKVRIDRAASDPFTTHEVLAAMHRTLLRGKRVVVQRYGETNRELQAALESEAADVIEIVTYRWGLPEDTAPLLRLIGALDRDEIDLVAFTSASQASNLFTVAQYHGKEASLKQSLGRTLVASIGPVCSVALRKLAVRVDIEANPPKLGPFIEAINTVLSGRRPLGKS